MTTFTLKLATASNTDMDKSTSIILQGEIAAALGAVKDVTLVDITDDLTGAEQPRRRRRKNAAATSATTTGTAE
jgi:hypothetical protein